MHANGWQRTLKASLISSSCSGDSWLSPPLVGVLGAILRFRVRV